MKILHISKKYPQALGGDAVVVSNLQKQQLAAGHQVVIVTSNCDEIASAKHVYKVGLNDTAAGLDTITPRRILSLVALFFRMFAILRKERPDVIHTHSIDMAFFASFAARLYRTPIIHTFHIVTFHDADQSAFRRKTELWLAKKARPRSITAPNTYDVKKLQAAGLRQSIWLPNGVDIAFWRTNVPGPKNEVFEFLAVGRLEPQKGYEYLIEAAALLASEQSESFRVLIVGEGSQKALLHELIRSLHLEAIVKLVGRKTPEQLRALYSQAGAAVLPSLYETTPLTLLEAWAAHVPVIVTPVGILRDAPSHFGAAQIVPAKDERSLMQAMKSWLKDPAARMHAAANGYEEAKKYAWPAIAQAAEAIYRGAQ